MAKAFVFFLIFIGMIIQATACLHPLLVRTNGCPSYGRPDLAECVKHLQTLLNCGWAGLSVDGCFGKLTFDAVVRFQTVQKLELIDGIVGKETWPKLHTLKCVLW